MSKYFVFVRINGEKAPGLMADYKAEGFPSIRFLTGDGRQIYGFDGYRPTQEFISEMEKARQSTGD